MELLGCADGLNGRELGWLKEKEMKLLAEVIQNIGIAGDNMEFHRDWRKLGFGDKKVEKTKNSDVDM